MIKSLTPPRAKFAAEVAKHGNQSEAYRVAFPKSRLWTNKAVHTAASAMMDVPEVARRVAELREQSEKKLGMTLEKWLASVAKETKDKNWKCRLSSFDMIAKSLGYYKQPEKPEANTTTVNVVHIDLSDRVARLDAEIAKEIEEHLAKRRAIPAESREVKP